MTSLESRNQTEASPGLRSAFAIGGGDMPMALANSWLNFSGSFPMTARIFTSLRHGEVIHAPDEL